MADQKKALIVEDDVLMGMELKDFIEGFDFQVSRVIETGEDAVQYARENKPDLILMDIRLKGKMDGIEASRQIRSSLSVPIIFLTGYKDASTAQQIASIPNTYLFTKPYNPGTLGSAIEDIAAGRSHPPESSSR
ncbi:MAG: response regulator [Deltaproteobacteria bacterium]